MSDTLRDQLLGLGFKPAPKPERKSERPAERKPEPRQPGRDAQPPRRRGKPAPGRQAPSRNPAAEAGSEPDLARAYALRNEQERREREAAERLRQQQAAQRKAARNALEALLKDKALNAPEAEHVRHFPYGGKIKRIHVTPEQLVALNAGELGVVQLNGRYLLVTAAVLAEAKALLPAVVALEVDPDAPAAEDPYGDPAYQVPDDLTW